MSLPEFSLQNSLILQSPEITGHYSFRLLGFFFLLLKKLKLIDKTIFLTRLNKDAYNVYCFVQFTKDFCVA